MNNSSKRIASWKRLSVERAGDPSDEENKCYRDEQNELLSLECHFCFGMVIITPSLEHRYGY